MDAFRQEPRFRRHLKQGKQAIKGEHRDLLVEAARAKVISSLDFEAAVADEDLDCKRFDYFIESSRRSGYCHAIEVHAFKPSELAQKKQGTLTLLARHCPAASAQVASWHVLVKGELPRQDLVAKFRADTRIYPSRHLKLDEL